MTTNLAEQLNFTDASRTYALGIMGGTFDPIHIGHLVLAEEVMDDNELDAVLFIPTGNPVFKLDKKVTPATMRLEMCELATRDNPAFAVSDIEVEREGATYTIDTLKTLKQQLPENVQFFFIVGSDVALTLHKWKDRELLGEYTRFIVAERPGSTLTAQQREQIAQQVSELDITYTNVALLDVSSTGIRARAAAGKSLRYLMPDAVREFIRAEGLYREHEGTEDV